MSIEVPGAGSHRGRLGVLSAGHRSPRAGGTPRRWLGAALALALASAALPLVSSDAVVADAALVPPAAALAAVAALALGCGRPLACVPALGAVAGYVAGGVVLEGHGWLAGGLAGVAAATLGGALVGAATARLGAAAVLVATAVAGAAGRALVDALGDHTGAEAGLGPLPAPALSAGDGTSTALAPAGLFHLALAVSVTVVAAAFLLLRAGPGARWRASGLDPRRAADSALRPALARSLCVAACGGLAGVAGVALAAAAGVQSPAPFGPDAAAVPLAAAVVAGAAGPGAAAIAAGLEAALVTVVLPHAGWSGPPGAGALGTGLLALAAVLRLLGPGARRWSGRAGLPGALSRTGGAGLAGPLPRVPRVEGSAAAAGPPLTSTAPSAPEPAAAPLRAPSPAAGLSVAGLEVRAGGSGPVLVADLALAVGSGEIHAVVGRNGSGKSSTLAAIRQALRTGRGARLEAACARVRQVDQEGGGFAACTVDETLRLAAAGAGVPRRDRPRVAASWAEAVAPGAADRLCVELPHGVRRRVEVARVLVAAPALLLADEPLAGLDDDERAAVRGLLAAAAGAGSTVLLVEHDRDAVAALCGDRVTDLG